MSRIDDLQEDQQRMLSAIFASSCLAGDPTTALYAEYKATVVELHDLLGPAAPCLFVDPFRYATYADLVRETTGEKPKPTVSFREVDETLRSSLNA